MQASYISKLLLETGEHTAITRVVPKRIAGHLSSNFHDLLIVQNCSETNNYRNTHIQAVPDGHIPLLNGEDGRGVCVCTRELKTVADKIKVKRVTAGNEAPSSSSSRSAISGNVTQSLLEDPSAVMRRSTAHTIITIVLLSGFFGSFWTMHCVCSQFDPMTTVSKVHTLPQSQASTSGIQQDNRIATVQQKNWRTGSHRRRCERG